MEATRAIRGMNPGTSGGAPAHARQLQKPESATEFGYDTSAWFVYRKEGEGGASQSKTRTVYDDFDKVTWVSKYLVKMQRALRPLGRRLEGEGGVNGTSAASSTATGNNNVTDNAFGDKVQEGAAEAASTDETRVGASHLPETLKGHVYTFTTEPIINMQLQAQIVPGCIYSLYSCSCINFPPHEGYPLYHAELYTHVKTWNVYVYVFIPSITWVCIHIHAHGHIPELIPSLCASCVQYYSKGVGALVVTNQVGVITVSCLVSHKLNRFHFYPNRAKLKRV